MVVALAVFLTILVASAIVMYALKALDRDSIVSLRRMFGLLLASNLLWSIPFLPGSLVSWIEHNRQPGLNEFILGAFFAWSIQLLVINGAFIPSMAASLCISAIQPVSALLLASPFVIRTNSSVLYPAALGVLVLAMTAAFLLKFKSFKTQAVGISSLQTFQSFLKSWVSQKPADLENYFALYSREEPVTTKLLLADGPDRVALVLPGVHPGPFFPVGSYNLSELIFHELRNSGITPIILHGAGGHERNLPTNQLTMQYAKAIAVAALSSETAQVGWMRGPCRTRFGPTCLTTLAFGNETLAFLSNAPYNTDDLEPSLVAQGIDAAKSAGRELMFIDAHNSIGATDCNQPAIDWQQVFSDISGNPEDEFDIGVAHSSEVEFNHGSDVSDGGITVLVFRKRGQTFALVASDSNNATVGLRQRIIDELKKEGVELIELCTSDTHNSAARYLTSRGYRALGEDTDLGTIITTIKRLEKLAEGRLHRGGVAAVTFQLTLPLIGEESLDDFAALARDSLRFAKAYAGAAIATAIVICFLALFY